jgi:hypothetical protein
MSSYHDFLSVISSLSSGTDIEVTEKWCTKHGLRVSANMMRGWGQKFSKDHSLYGCSRKTVSPTQGTAKDKSTNNLRHYIKN